MYGKQFGFWDTYNISLYFQFLASTKFSPFEAAPSQPSYGQHPPRARTLAEIEAEQRAAAQLARMSLNANQPSPQLHQAIPQQQPQHLEQPRDYRHSPLLQQASPNVAMQREIMLRAQQEHEEQQRFLVQQQQQQLQQRELQQRELQQRELQQRELLQLQQQQQLQEAEYLHQQQRLQELELLQQQQQQHQQQIPQREQQLLYQQQQQQRLLQQQLLSAQSGMPRTPGRHPLLEQQLNLLDAAGSSLTPEERQTLMNEAMNKILEAERMEEKRRRRLTKIARMVYFIYIISL